MTGAHAKPSKGQAYFDIAVKAAALLGMLAGAWYILVPILN